MSNRDESNDSRANLEQRLYNQARSGAVGARDQASGKTLMWHRDLGNCWQFLVHEAMTAANEALGKDPETFDILSTLSQGFKEIYINSMEDNHKGMSGFREIYAFIEEKGEKGMTAYATFSAFLVQTMFCFMFTGRKLAVGLPQDLDNIRVHEFQSGLTFLSLLDDDLRIEATKQFRDRGLFPTNVDISSLLRRLDDFLAIMLKDKEVHTKEMQERHRRAQEQAVARKNISATRKKDRKNRKHGRKKK